MKFSRGDLILITGPIGYLNEERGTWAKIPTGTKLICIKYDKPSDTIYVLLPDGSAGWLNSSPAVGVNCFKLLSAGK